MKKRNSNRESKPVPIKPTTWSGNWYLDARKNVIFSPTVETDTEYQELRKRVGLSATLKEVKEGQVSEDGVYLGPVKYRKRSAREEAEHDDIARRDQESADRDKTSNSVKSCGEKS